MKILTQSKVCATLNQLLGESAAKKRIIFGLGSNLGDRNFYLDEAVLELTQQLIAENRTSEVAEMYNITITTSKSKLDRVIDYVGEGKTNDQIATAINEELTPSYNNVLNTIRNAVAEGKTREEIKTMIEGG